MARHGLSDADWARIEALFPAPASRGRPRRDSRTLLNGMLWILRTGAPWRDLPERFGPFQTVHRRFCEWREGGVLIKVVEALQGELNDEGEIDWEVWCVDGTTVRAARCAAGARKKGRYPMSRKITPLDARAVA